MRVVSYKPVKPVNRQLPPRLFEGRVKWGQLASGDAHHGLHVPDQLNGLWRRRCPADMVAQLADHLMERVDLLVGDPGLGDLDEIEHRPRVDDGKEAAGVAWLPVGFKGFQAGLFEDRESVHSKLVQKDT